MTASVGYSVIAKMRETVGLALAYENFGSIYFRNNARPNVVLKHPGKLKPEARTNLRESGSRLHSEGRERPPNGRAGRGDGGPDDQHQRVRQSTPRGQDVQPRGHRQLLRRAPTRWGTAAAHPTTPSNRRTKSLCRGRGRAGYWLPSLGQRVRGRKLLTEEEKRQPHPLLPLEDEPLAARAIFTTRTAYYVALKNAGILNADEIREEEGYNPIPDGLG